MIFVTLGSQKFQFNRLLIKIDELVEDGTITDEVFAQIGYSDYQPIHYKFKEFLNRDEYGEAMARSNVVITHGGTGAIIGALKLGKKVLAVPRLVEYGEHVDDHQLQIVEEFENMKSIVICKNIDEMENKYLKLYEYETLPYISNTNHFVTRLTTDIDKENIKILVISNMYPNKSNPYYGIFVKNFCEQLDTLDLKYIKAIMFKSKSKIDKIFKYIKFYCISVFKLLFFRYDLIYVHYASHSGIPVIFANKLRKK